MANRHRRSARVLLIVAASAAAMASADATLAMFRRLDREPTAHWMEARYDRLREHLRHREEFGFSTDMPPSRAAGRRLHVAQWAGAPALLVHDFDLTSLVGRLERGFAVVLDFNEAAELERRLDEFSAWATAAKKEHEIVRIEDRMALIATTGRNVD